MVSWEGSKKSSVSCDEIAVVDEEGEGERKEGIDCCVGTCLEAKPENINTMLIKSIAMGISNSNNFLCIY